MPFPAQYRKLLIGIFALVVFLGIAVVIGWSFIQDHDIRTAQTAKRMAVFLSDYYRMHGQYPTAEAFYKQFPVDRSFGGPKDSYGYNFDPAKPDRFILEYTMFSKHDFAIGERLISEFTGTTYAYVFTGCHIGGPCYDGEYGYWERASQNHPTSIGVTQAQAIAIARSKQSISSDVSVTAKLVSSADVDCLPRKNLWSDTSFWAILPNIPDATTIYIGAESGGVIGTCNAYSANLPLAIYTVTLYAHEKNGSHIFEGAIIAVMEKSTGKIVTEMTADKDGYVVFHLPPGDYRFQPSPLHEYRVVGLVDLTISYLQVPNQTIDLPLTEIGPAGFGAAVKTCDDKRVAIDDALESATYCEQASDCQFFQPDGFGCWLYINRLYDTSTVMRAIQDFAGSCPLTAYKCSPHGPAFPPLCFHGKCTHEFPK